MLAIDKQVMVTDCTSGTVPEWVMSSAEPVLLKGLVDKWPLVQAGLKSPLDADLYLRRFNQDATVVVSYGKPEIRGRVFYNSDLSGFNFESHRTKFDTVLDEIRQHLDDRNPPLIYVGSTTVDTCLPGFRAENDISLGDVNPLVSIWIGNQTRIPAHYDLPDNIACNVVGHRLFTLFPPDQLANLYIGPMDLTPAGQPISLVDFSAPDLKKFPRFGVAIKHAQVAELEPGDALLIPSMWWHHVEGLDSLNILINYWWRKSPSYMGPPIDVLKLALMTIRDLPEEQKRAWENIFNYYVFNADETVTAHIPERERGVLAPINDVSARKIRAELLNKLNR